MLINGDGISKNNYVWCLVGNIIESHFYGEEKEIKFGTKQFPSRTKVYCLTPRWGDGYEKIMVLGRGRAIKKFILVVTHSKYINNWRKQKVYNPYIIRRINEAGGWNSEEEVSIMLKSIIEYENNEKRKNG